MLNIVRKTLFTSLLSLLRVAVSFQEHHALLLLQGVDHEKSTTFVAIFDDIVSFLSEPAGGLMVHGAGGS